MTPAADWGTRPLAVVSSAHEVGGAEVYLMALAEELGRSLPVVALLPAAAPGELVDALERAGVETRPVRGLARRPSPLAAARLAAALRMLDPALVHVNLTDQGDGVAALAAASAARRPATATLHLVIPRSAAWLERLSRAALGRTRRVVAVSESVAVYLTERGVATTVVANGVAPPPTDPDARAELGVEAGAALVGGIGRLDRQKGWDVLCAAAPLVRERVPDARIVVVGDGPERERLTALGRDAGVAFAGYRERAGRFAGAFDVVVVPSRYEGFGLVAVEAMLAGVPVVASDVGGLPEVVGDAGVLVPPEDPKALGAAVAGLLTDRERARELGARGRRRAEERFGRARMAAETLAVWLSARAGPTTLEPMDESEGTGR